MTQEFIPVFIQRDSQENGYRSQEEMDDISALSVGLIRYMKTFKQADDQDNAEKQGVDPRKLFKALKPPKKRSAGQSQDETEIGIKEKLMHLLPS
jgi:hypothetical protein